MKISLIVENLAKGLNITSKIATTKNTLPVLGNILLKTDKGMIKISSTNLEIGINYWVGGKIEEEGEITIPSRTLTDFVLAQDSQDKIEIEAEKDNIIIKTKNAEAKIKGISATEFPLIPEVNKNKLAVFKKEVFSTALKNVIFAAAGLNDARPVLSGVYFNFKDDYITIAATDSFRLAEKKLKLVKKSEKEVSFIVPARTIQEFIRIIDLVASEEVEIINEENQVLFKCDEVEIVTRLIEGSFPAYAQIVPESTETKALLSAQEFLKNLKIANVFAKDENGSIKLEVLPAQKGQEVTLKADSAVTGQLNTKIPAKADGKEVEVALNVRYLLDVLNTLGKDTVELGFSGGVSPVVVKSIDEKDYIYIIMPLRA